MGQHGRPSPSRKAPRARSHVGSPAGEGRVPLFAEERVQRALVAMVSLAPRSEACLRPTTGHDACVSSSRLRGERNPVVTEGCSAVPRPSLLRVDRSRGKPAGSSQERVGRAGRQGSGACAFGYRCSGPRRSPNWVPVCHADGDAGPGESEEREVVLAGNASKTDSIGAPARETACGRGKREGSANHETPGRFAAAAFTSG